MYSAIYIAEICGYAYKDQLRVINSKTRLHNRAGGNFERCWVWRKWLFHYQFRLHGLGLPSSGGGAKGQVMRHALLAMYVKLISKPFTNHGQTPLICVAMFYAHFPSAQYMRHWFSVLIFPAPHICVVTNDSLLSSAPNSRRSPTSLISAATHICGAS